jgi:hypothetical protein
MRLEASVNDRELCTALLHGAGTLAAHVVMSTQADGRIEPCELRVEGAQRDSAEPIALRWQGTHLGVGDEVRLRVLADGPGQEPAERLSSAVPPPPLPLNSEAHSAGLVALCNRFSSDLFAWMEQAIAAEPAAHRVPIKLAVSSVAYALTERLLYPAYLQRPHLVPPEIGRLI